MATSEMRAQLFDNEDVRRMSWRIHRYPINQNLNILKLLAETGFKRTTTHYYPDYVTLFTYRYGAQPILRQTLRAMDLFGMRFVALHSDFRDALVSKIQKLRYLSQEAFAREIQKFVEDSIITFEEDFQKQDAESICDTLIGIRKARGISQGQLTLKAGFDGRTGWRACTFERRANPFMYAISNYMRGLDMVPCVLYPDIFSDVKSEALYGHDNDDPSELADEIMSILLGNDPNELNDCLDDCEGLV